MNWLKAMVWLRRGPWVDAEVPRPFRRHSAERLQGIGRCREETSDRAGDEWGRVECRSRLCGHQWELQTDNRGLLVAAVRRVPKRACRPRCIFP